ncbi:MAG: DUF6301 family protein [Propionibacteriaceae bacterium]|nr:DUF6301 family protein [Propionibacteriaceae bacterium]
MEYITPLPDGSTYRVVPVQQGIKVIRTWAEHPWPMTTTQALALRDHFGWASSPTKKNIFTTNHNTRPKDASFVSVDNVTVSGFTLVLSSLYPEEATSTTEPTAQLAFNAYTEALNNLYGKGKKKNRKGIRSVIWTLPTGATINLGITRGLLDVVIDSPEYNAAAAGEELYFEEIMSEEEEEREVPIQPSRHQP